MKWTKRYSSTAGRYAYRLYWSDTHTIIAKRVVELGGRLGWRYFVYLGHGTNRALIANHAEGGYLSLSMAKQDII